MSNNEDSLLLECGCDETGRGSAIGEIYVCAVILDKNYPIDGLRDSKKLTPHKRELLAEEIKQHALAWSLATASLEEIEQYNVHHANLRAMKRAIEGLAVRPVKVWVDGKYIPQIDIPAEAVIKGDDKIACISAASIIAKVERDRAMLEYDKLYPEFGIAHHKGYLTKEHMDALHQYGPCPAHRKTYAPVKEVIGKFQQIKMFE